MVGIRLFHCRFAFPTDYVVNISRADTGILQSNTKIFPERMEVVTVEVACLNFYVCKEWRQFTRKKFVIIFSAFSLALLYNKVIIFGF